MVPMLTCGLLRWNLALPICVTLVLSLQKPSRRAPLSELRLHLFSDVRRHLVIVRELHRVLGAPLAEGAKLINVAEHIRKRHHRLDDLGIAAAVRPLDLTAPAVQVT